MKIVGIIPSRYDSIRFPGKALLDLKGKTMIQRVYEQVQKELSFSYIVVATDDERIKKNVEGFGGNVIMTSSDHETGTERCCEAAKKLQTSLGLDNNDVIINIQGDEPLIAPASLGLLSKCFEKKEVDINTLIKPIVSQEDLFNNKIAKVIVNRKNQIIYFSRSTIPHFRDKQQEDWINHHRYLKQVGIYGYRFGILKEISQLKQTPLESAEKLEQLRWIENGYIITAQETPYESFSIDTPEDVAKVEKLIK